MCSTTNSTAPLHMPDPTKLADCFQNPLPQLILLIKEGLNGQQSDIKARSPLVVNQILHILAPDHEPMYTVTTQWCLLGSCWPVIPELLPGKLLQLTWMLRLRNTALMLSRFLMVLSMWLCIAVLVTDVCSVLRDCCNNHKPVCTSWACSCALQEKKNRGQDLKTVPILEQTEPVIMIRLETSRYYGFAHRSTEFDSWFKSAA